MADRASRTDAVVIHGPRGEHSEDEVLSWHHINGEPAEEILPALLITTRHPSTIRRSYGPASGLSVPQDAMLLISLKKRCKTARDVTDLIQKVFEDIAAKKSLSDFQVARQKRKGLGRALVDAIVLEPSLGGVGVDLKQVFQALFSKRTEPHQP
ncbi:MAG: hypothetical protein P4L85_23570 [Paludisphaera borealis]|uniref:hypothetical protein n=1 Tax=Paludisphaera borealis TaxID=1387353 RepID=UPI002840F033|nr:hypothetical protein [Paludisphaera borealis]MDR3622350.1 hypothetical protein [Paludisphaera borealis]